MNLGRYLLHDRDAKYCASFRETMAAGGCEVCAAASAEPEGRAPEVRFWGRHAREKAVESAARTLA